MQSIQKIKKNIIIIDGYGFVFRAFFSLQDLTTKSGLPIGAVHGFINMVLKVINNLNPQCIAVVFDSGKKSFRSDIYKDYKAHRKEVHPDLIPQFAIVREATTALNIKQIEMEGYEADDVIASMAKQYSKEGIKVTIVSSDKDLMQLTKDGEIEFYDALKAKFLKEDDVRQKFGVNASQISDYLAIVGDASDNIPGVKGIGEKGAAELLNDFSTLKDIYQNLDKITKNRLKSSLEEGKESAFLSYKLTELQCSLEVPESDYFTIIPFEKEALFDFLQKYDLHSISNKLLPNFTKQQEDLFSIIEFEDITISNQSDLNLHLNSIKSEEILLKVEKGDIILEADAKRFIIKI